MLLAIHQGLRSHAGRSSLRCCSTTCSNRSCSTSSSTTARSNRLAGFYTINEERLAALDARGAGELHQRGLPAGRSTWRSPRCRTSATLIERQNRLNAARSLNQSREIAGLDPQRAVRRRADAHASRWCCAAWWRAGRMVRAGLRIGSATRSPTCAASIADATVGAMLGAPDIERALLLQRRPQRLQFQAP